jgi:2-polyprenyl-3-methyl-5-hydroxy-6-metoxy-1,4-benzoquinol methylase
VSAPASTAVCWACAGEAQPAEDLEPYWRCDSCGLVFQPQRSAGAVHDLYDGTYFEEFPGIEGDYGAAGEDRLHEARVRLRFVRRRVRGGRLLEVGAAEGHFLEVAREAGFEGFGVEPAAEAAAAGRDRAGVEIVTGFIEDVALPAEPFDLACAWHVLEHIAEPLASLERIRGRLVPGGRLFVEVPNIESVPAREAGAAWPHLQPRHHVGQYGPRALRALLERAGFAVEAVETVPFFGYFRPAVRIRPVMLAAHARESARLGVLPFGAHPSKHELLRAVARTRG